MIISKEVSERIQILKLISIFLVVILHSHIARISFQYYSVEYQLKTFAIFLDNLFSGTLARAAVPFFFIVSATLFFKEGFLSRQLYLSKLRSRVRSLLVPLIFWNISILLCLWLCNYFGLFKMFFNQGRGALPEPKLFAIIDAIFGFTRTPFVYQFWFIRDLVLFSVLSPLIYIFTKKTPKFTIFILGIYFFVNTFPPNKDYDAVLFFVLGALIALKLKQLRVDFRQKTKLIILAAFIFAIVEHAFLLTLIPGGIYFKSISSRFVIILSIIILWILVGEMHGKIRRIFIKLSGLSFFIFAAHEPLMNIVRKLLIRAMSPSNDFMVILLYYFLTPLSTITICILSGILLRKYCLNFYSMITGGRI